MFYFLSKTVGQLTNISVVYGASLTICFVLLIVKQTRKWGLVGLICVNAAILVITSIPVGDMLNRHLEQRFKRPDLSQLEVAGFITLSGVIDPKSFLKRGEVHFGASADRVFAMLEMANNYPDKPMIFSGGDGHLHDRGFSEAEVLKNWLYDSRLHRPNLYFETISRNTHENAVNTRKFAFGKWPELMQKPWVLITSAKHMPRAVGAFRQAGWNVIPYPVDRQTSDEVRLASLNVSGAITSVSRGLHEWVGLTAYYLTGRTNEWFPGPLPEDPDN